MDLLRVIFGVGLLVVGLVFLLAARDECRQHHSVRATIGAFGCLLVLAVAAVLAGLRLLGII